MQRVHNMINYHHFHYTIANISLTYRPLSFAWSIQTVICRTKVPYLIPHVVHSQDYIRTSVKAIFLLNMRNTMFVLCIFSREKTKGRTSTKELYGEFLAIFRNGCEEQKSHTSAHEKCYFNAILVTP